MISGVVVNDSVRVGGQIKKCVTRDKEAVIVAIEARNLVAEVQQIHRAAPAGTYHLGYGLMAGLLLQALPDAQVEEKLELQWKSQGPFGSLYIEAREGGRVRGTLGNASPPESGESLEVGLGEGLFQVRRFKKSDGVASGDTSPIVTTGIVEAKGNVILDCLEYLERSEQRMCSMNLWIDISINKNNLDNPFQVNQALGFLVHVMGAHQQQVSDAKLWQWDQHLRSLGRLKSWMLGPDPTADILSFISGEYKPYISGSYSVSSFCTCSEERAERALAIVSQQDKKEGREPLTGQQPVVCEFCGRQYDIQT